MTDDTNEPKITRAKAEELLEGIDRLFMNTRDNLFSEIRGKTYALYFLNDGSNSIHL